MQDTGTIEDRNAARGFTVPDNVPDERIVDFDIYNPPGGSEDPHRAWLRLRAGPDIQWTPHNAGHWILTRAEDIEYVWRKPDPFSNLSVEIPPNTKPMRFLPQESDPPEHAAYRAIANMFFSPKAIQPLEQEIRQLTKTLLDRFQPRGECEFIADYSLQLPIIVFLGMVGLPLTDREMLHDWTSSATRGKTDQIRSQAYEKISLYIQQAIAQRREHPGDDLFSVVMRSKVAGRPLDDGEVLSFCTTLLFGGLDTVVSSLGFVAHFLAQNERHRRELIAHRERIPNAVNELLRRFSVTTNARILSRDFDYKGIHFRKGDRISLGAPLHGLDEEKFNNPLEVDFSRVSAEIGTFGFGPHRCPGSFLARTEIRVFLEEWLERIPEFGIKPGDKAVFSTGRINSVIYLPLTWPVA